MKQFSGVYPHLAWTNGSKEVEEWECGTGAIVPWAGKLWVITYPAHKYNGSHDKLFMLHEDMTMEAHPASVGGTHANRMIHRESNQLIIGPYFIDSEGGVRVVPPAQMPGRLTAVARHLEDPANKVMFYTMESGLYEVNVHNLEVTTLYRDPNDIPERPYLLPGVHGKGAYSGQRRLVVSNNGEGGVLAEWTGIGDPADRNSWRIVDANKYTEITGPGGLYGAPDDKAPLWALGWDAKSVLLNVCEHGEWKRFRLPMASYTHSADDGWFTEWPRIRNIGDGQWLMDMFGMMYEFPATFSHNQTAGIRPLAIHHKMIVDFVNWNGKLVMGCNDASIQENPHLGRCQSNLLFTSLEELRQWGSPEGWGGVWVKEDLQDGAVSEPFHFAGYDSRILHLTHSSPEEIVFTVELDEDGTGNWKPVSTLPVAPGGYKYELLPSEWKAEWIRLRVAGEAKQATAWFYLAAAELGERDNGLFAALPEAGSTAAHSEALLFPPNDMSLPLHAASAIVNEQNGIVDRGFYQGDVGLTFQRQDTPELEAKVRGQYTPSVDVLLVEGAVIIQDKYRNQVRLPKGHPAFDQQSPDGGRRYIREVVTERKLLNAHGTFYELPDPHSGGLKKLRPVATHNRLIRDFCSWRGMLVLSGTSLDSVEDGGHTLRSPDGKLGLWLGNVDDLRRFDAPAGKGGPWVRALALAERPSDPYLMIGYRHKVLELSHEQNETVNVRVEVDVWADDTWLTYGEFSILPGQTVTHVFPEGYNAHWVRVVSDRDARITAMFTYN